MSDTGGAGHAEKGRMAAMIKIRKPLKIVELDVTCDMCPYQAEMRTATGRPVYARERWEHMSITVGRRGQSIDDICGWGGTDLLVLGLDYRADGYVRSFNEFKERTSMALDLTAFEQDAGCTTRAVKKEVC